MSAAPSVREAWRPGWDTIYKSPGTPHWHIDYLRSHGRLSEIWYGHGPTFDEHRWMEVLRWMAGTRSVTPGFGSSDCRCETHLIYFATQPAIARFRRRQPKLPGVRRRPIYRLPLVSL